MKPPKHVLERRAYQKKWREANSDKIRLYRRRYYIANIPLCNRWAMTWRKDNPEKYREYQKLYHRKYRKAKLNKRLTNQQASIAN